MEIKVSVIMPVYNAHSYLPEAMDDLLNQTLKDIEIICVNDGSSDDSLEILKAYAEKDARVRIVDQENQGAGAAKNHGMKYAQGEYLSILDCDDFFEPDMLEKSYLAAKEQKSDVLVFGCDFFDDQSGTYTPCKYSINTKLLPKNNLVCAEDAKKDVFKLFVGWSWDKLFLTEFVRENHLLFQEQRTTNDMLFVFSGVIRARIIYTMPEVLIHHRRAAGTLSVTREKSWQCFYRALMALRIQLEQWNVYERFERDFVNYSLHFSLWNLNTLCEPTYTTLRDKLCDEWFDELGISRHPASYFYNSYEYSQFEKLTAPAGSAMKLQPMDAMGSIILRGWKCLVENGFRYTLRNIWNKILRRLWRIK